jgi:hypothetical protein
MQRDHVYLSFPAPAYADLPKWHELRRVLTETGFSHGASVAIRGSRTKGSRIYVFDDGWCLVHHGMRANEHHRLDSFDEFLKTSTLWYLGLNS